MHVLDLFVCLFVCLFVFPLCSQACPIVLWNCSWKCSIFPTPHNCNTFLFISSLTVGVKPRYPHFLGSVKLNLHWCSLINLDPQAMSWLFADHGSDLMAANCSDAFAFGKPKRYFQPCNAWLDGETISLML